MKNINIIVGRFQPISNAHINCAYEAFAKKGIKTILCIIDVKEEKVNELHPFPSSIILPIYKELFFNHDIIEDVVLVKSANIVQIDELLYNMGYEIDSWVCGSDRIVDYTRMSQKYKAESHLTPTFEMIEVKRNDKDISATLLRQFLLIDDYKNFSNISPLKDYYKILRSQILKVYE